jgi:Ran GTPase-activating protein (RanGAP) involved in mRNA processing and transport
MDAKRLVFEGSERPEIFQKKLELAVNDINITELEFVDIIWAESSPSTDQISENQTLGVHLDRQDVDNTLRLRPFKNVTIRGGQGPCPWHFRSVRKVCLHQVQIHLPPCRQRSDPFDPHRLTELSLVSMSIPQDLVTSLAALLRNTSSALTNLELTDSHFRGETETHDLFASLRENTSLRQLSFSECNLRGESLSRIFNNLCEHPSISHLDISFNKPELNSSAIVDLSQLIWSSSTLENVNLGFLAFGSGRQVDLSQLFRCLSDENHNPPLKVLQIGGNNLRDEQMQDIVTMLMRNESIQQLDLSNNGFTNDGIHLLAESLATLKRLRILDLQENPFDQEGVQMLVDCMDSTTLLVAVEVDEELADTHAYRLLDWHLDLNWSGARRMRHHLSHPICASLWPLILERTNHKGKNASFEREPSAKDILFYFLRRSPLMTVLCS